MTAFPSEPREILAECARRGIVLRPHESGGIWFSAPRGALTEDLRRAILRHKAEILRLLTEAAQYDSLDYRRDPATGRWVRDPGWWRAIPQRPSEPPKVVEPPPLPPAEGRTPPRAVTLALSLQPDGSCYCCKGSRWWLSRYGVLVCAACHPPAMPELVARHVDGEEAVRLARS